MENINYNWVNIDKELPSDQRIVLVKTSLGCYSTAYLHGKESGFIPYGDDAYFDFGEIIEWKDIK